MVGLQRTWLNLQHALAAAQQLFDFVSELEEKENDALPDNPCIGVGLALVCSINVVYYAKQVVNRVSFGILYSILTAVTIGFQVVDDAFELETLGAHH